jgi:4-hydroxy-tetrahydrodipicolinate reductase
MSDDVKIGIVGAAGRMGQMLVRQVTATAGCRVVGATEGPGSPALGKDAGALAGVGDLGVAITEDPATMIANVDVVIDFTVPAATAEHARLAAQAEAALIAGTTGLNAEQEESVRLAARHVPVVRAPNFSIGITLLLALTEQVSGILGPEYDIEILEMHHRHKVDAPGITEHQAGNTGDNQQ